MPASNDSFSSFRTTFSGYFRTTLLTFTLLNISTAPVLADGKAVPKLNRTEILAIETKARKGDLLSQFKLAEYYEVSGVACPNEGEIINWLEKASASGNADGTGSSARSG